VALGASNLTRGLPALRATARESWGPAVEVMAALGLGRSYGMPSTVALRRLPGILDCGLWAALEGRPALRTRALVTDVGNDILYGADAPLVLDWVEACVTRLQRFTDDVVVTDLPLDRIRRLSRAAFLFFRTLFVPACRRSFEDVLRTSEQVVDGLRDLARRRSARLAPLRPEWYGLDPIHMRPRRWSEAWREILGAPGPGRVRLKDAVRLHSAWPERQWLLGVERATAQPAREGLWLY
jgi:hypothetical protein